MPQFQSARFITRALAAFCLATVPCSLLHAAGDYRELHSVDPQGSVEITELAGSLDVSGWDRPEVEVTGTEGSAGRVRVTISGNHTTIQVLPFSLSGENNASHLTIHVPERSALSASLVSANLSVSGVQGDVNLRTINGNLSGEVGGSLRANTATGSVTMTARGAKSIEVKTINGNVRLNGGAGEVDVGTVSGDVTIDLATLTNGNFRSISGNMSANLSLAPDARLEGESVSGNLHFDFPAQPTADFEIQTVSGDIENCFGPKATKAQYGPGSRLEFKTGEGDARVHIRTKSGNIKLCTVGAH
jgi:DUF4097 and DUF4098 domain-containing protein YvlB